MSVDVVVFHSSEVDAPPAAGWYVGTIGADGVLLCDESAVGPFDSQAAALSAMAAGEWIGGAR